MVVLLFFLVILQIFCLIMLIRTNLIFKYRTKAIDVIYNYQMWVIDNCSEKHTHSMWDITEQPGYNTMMFMIACWTYKSFYGNLEQRMKEITDAVVV